MVPVQTTVQAWLTSLRARPLQTSKASLSSTSYGANTLPDKLSHRYGFGQRMEQEFNDPVHQAPGHWRGQITSKDVPDCHVPAERKQMKVYVIGWNGLGLAPTTPRKARLLLSRGRLPPAIYHPS